MRIVINLALHTTTWRAWNNDSAQYLDKWMNEILIICRVFFFFIFYFIIIIII